MITRRPRAEPPGWHGRPIEDLPWAVVVRVAVCWGVACMILTLLAAAFLPRPFGFIGTTVVTGSMMPNIQPGDVALVQPIEEYGLGQVILFPSPSDPDVRIMHRIVEIEPDGMLITKGDANEMRDSTPIDPDTVIGVGRILVPAIGLPIVWAVNGFFLLVILTVLLTALLVRGTLTIEFFPSTRKRDYVRAIIESTAVIAMLGVASVVVVVGAARSAHAAFIDDTETDASWAMATSAPTPTPTQTSAPTPTPTQGPSGKCSITQWNAKAEYPGDNARVDLIVRNDQSTPISAPWQLTWNFAADEQVSGTAYGKISQAANAVTYQSETWAYLAPAASQAAQFTMTSATRTFVQPLNVSINGMPCAFPPEIFIFIPLPPL